jgi:hypothetical protein
MPRLLPLLTVVALACGPRPYVQPRPDEPHAILKIRHVVHARGGPIYATRTMLGDNAIDERALQPEQRGADIVHLRVRPEQAVMLIQGRSYHHEQRQVQRSRQVPETYSCPQQDCTPSYSPGGYSSSTCRTVYRTCTRYRTEYYWVTETVEVNDDQCARRFALAPQQGHVYLVQFNYIGANECTAQCFEQLPSATGAFELAPCPVPRPPE